MKVSKFRIIVFSVLFFWATHLSVCAEEITLKNGDRLSGDVIQDTGESIVVATQAMGEISINKEFIESPAAYAKSAEPVAVPMETPEPKSDVAWLRKISIAYSQAGGNTEQSQGNIALAINRKTGRDEWTAKGDAFYSSSDKKMDAKKISGMIRYAYSFGQELKWYDFYKVEGTQDHFANINYRIVPSTGFGYWLSDQEDFKAMAEAALGYEYTNYRDNTKSDGDFVLVTRAYLEKKLSEDLKR